MNDVGTFASYNFETLWRGQLRAMSARRAKGAPAGGCVIMTEKAEQSARLVAIAQQADKAAFAELFGYFAPRLKGFFMRGGMAAGQAEELAQETMLMVWRKAALYDPAKASASTWIFTIARNLRVDSVRRERYPAQHLLEDPAPELPASPSDEVLRTESEHRVRTAIDLLSADQLNVIRLHYFDDKPHSEIAKVLGLPLGTVKSRLRLAMQRLRGLLGEEQ